MASQDLFYYVSFPLHDACRTCYHVSKKAMQQTFESSDVEDETDMKNEFSNPVMNHPSQSA
jgi:hypothetical protein